jgi:hypothetical protein
VGEERERGKSREIYNKLTSEKLAINLIFAHTYDHLVREK